MDEGKEKERSDGRSAGADDGKADFVPARRTAAGLEAITMSTSTRGARMGVSIATAAASAMGWSIFHRCGQSGMRWIYCKNQLASCRKGGVVATGSMSDPYNPLEEKQRLTRGMLTLLLRYSFGVSIATKSSLVERDIDLLEQIKGYAPALVKLTITTPHDHLAEQLEPHAPSSSRRLQTLERLRARGIFAGVLLMPVLPFLEDDPKDIRLLVERCAQAEQNLSTLILE